MVASCSGFFRKFPPIHARPRRPPPDRLRQPMTWLGDGFSILRKQLHALKQLAGHLVQPRPGPR
eukprot:7233611-Prymnesium_polylepis.1